MIRGPAILLCLVLNLLLWGSLVLTGGLVKFLTFGSVRRRVILALSWLGERWVQGNDQIIDLFLTTRWEVEGLDRLRRDGRYLIISNHVCWIDIFALFRAFHGKVAFIRFFLKSILIWFPIAGLACWALEFPFMRRYSPQYLAQHPEKRGRDLETTRIACQRYRKIPVAILNFVEGTRFSPEKQEDQRSPYRFLLRPRVGGIAFVLASLGDQLDAMFDVTIVYPRRDATMWDLVTNRLEWVHVSARRIDIPPRFHDPAVTQSGPAREELKAWFEGIWREKDERIADIIARRGA